jgi:hypothetical protein
MASRSGIGPCDSYASSVDESLSKGKNMQFIRRLAAIVALFAAVQGIQDAPIVQVARAQGEADAVVQPPCDEDAFDEAYKLIEERAGGTIAFNCGGAATINFTTIKIISLPVTIDGANQITLSGGNSTQLFQVDVGDSLTLRGLTLTLGFSAADGGAIVNFGTLSLEGSTIQNSNAAGSGGAIVSYGPLTITDSTLAGNSAANAGAVYPRFSAATTVIVNSSLRNNRATSTVDGWGGAILAWDGANVTIQGGEIAKNSARSGGGIHNRFVNSSVTLTNVQVNGNMARADTITQGIDGGGIYNINGAVTVDNSTFLNNDAGWSGGGMYTEGVATVNNSTFVGNSALAFGGGVANEAGAATFKGALFSNNSADLGAGVSNTGGLTIQNATFSGNRVREDAVLVNYGRATVQNATFSENIDATEDPGASVLWQVSSQPLRLKNVAVKGFADGGFGGVNCSSFNLEGYVPIISDGFNLSDDTSCAPFFNKAGDKNNTDPQLGPLGDNGGATLTHLPEPSSPLLDGGQCISGLAIDQRGVARPQGAACDIGAVEVRPADQQKKVFVPLVLR